MKRSKKSDPEIEFYVGDVVRLKSGGPKMVVDSIGPTNLVCKWFTYGSGNVSTENFAPETLTIVEVQE